MSTEASGVIEIRAPCWNAVDFTTYVNKVEMDRSLVGARFDRERKEFETKKRINSKFRITWDDCSVEGRGLACLCCDNLCVSITIRRERMTGTRLSCPFLKEMPDSTWSGGPASGLADVVFQATLDVVDPVEGAIVIMGETGCGKNTLAKALIHRWLATSVKKQAKQQYRRPHLITLQDPFEEHIEPIEPIGASESDASWSGVVSTASKLGIDLTPRRLTVDATQLLDAIEDALRQKPAILYIDEIRSDDDWRHVMTFSGTGHLLVTTAHARTLPEAMSKLLGHRGKMTPAERERIASSLLAVIHIRCIGSESLRIPSLWRRTSSGLAQFVTDGYSALLPHRPRAQTTQATELGCLGRLWFAEQLIPPTWPNRNKLIDHALRCDLQGL